MAPPRIIAEGSYAILDIESTGLSSKADEAVQIAFGQIDEGRTRLRGYYTLRPHRAISPGAAEKHGFTHEKLQDSPSFGDIAYELRILLGGRIVLGYNSKTFDVPILKRQFAEAAIEFDPKVLDVLWWARKLFPGVKHSLVEMVQRLEITPLVAHDAWHDCRMAWQVFGRLAIAFPEALGNLSPDEALSVQEGKAK